MLSKPFESDLGQNHYSRCLGASKRYLEGKRTALDHEGVSRIPLTPFWELTVFSHVGMVNLGFFFNLLSFLSNFD